MQQLQGSLTTLLVRLVLTSASEEQCDAIYAEQRHTQPATVAPHQTFSTPLFLTDLTPKRSFTDMPLCRLQTCRYDPLVPLVQVTCAVKFSRQY